MVSKDRRQCLVAEARESLCSGSIALKHNNRVHNHLFFCVGRIWFNGTQSRYISMANEGNIKSTYPGLLLPVCTTHTTLESITTMRGFCRLAYTTLTPHR